MWKAPMSAITHNQDLELTQNLIWNAYYILGIESTRMNNLCDKAFYRKTIRYICNQMKFHLSVYCNEGDNI